MRVKILRSDGPPMGYAFVDLPTLMLLLMTSRDKATYIIEVEP